MHASHSAASVQVYFGIIVPYFDISDRTGYGLWHISWDRVRAQKEFISIALSPSNSLVSNLPRTLDWHGCSMAVARQWLVTMRNSHSAAWQLKERKTLG